jgi:hypothetical protein
MDEYIGDKPEPSRVVQLNDHRKPPVKPPKQQWQPPASSLGQYWSTTRSGSGRGPGGHAPYIDPEREEQRKQEAIKQIMRRKR